MVGPRAAVSSVLVPAVLVVGRRVARGISFSPAASRVAVFAVLVGTHQGAYATDVISWESDSICVGVPARMTLENAGGRCGVEFTLHFDPTKLAVDSVRTAARAADLGGSKFSFAQAGKVIGVLFDDDGPGAIRSGVGPVVEIFLAPVVSYVGYSSVTFDEIIVADESAQKVIVTSLSLQVCYVGIQISDVSAEQTDDGSARISWTVGPAQGIDGFDVLRSVGVRDGDYLQVNRERVRGEGRLVFLDESEAVQRGGRFFYKLLAHERTGETSVYGPIELVTQDRTIPVAFALHQSFPNPLVSSAVFRYDVPRAEHVSLRIYDVAGRLVRSLVDGPQRPGRLVVSWNRLNEGGKRVASGIYFYRMRTPSFVASRKLVVR